MFSSVPASALAPQQAAVVGMTAPEVRRVSSSKQRKRKRSGGGRDYTGPACSCGGQAVYEAACVRRGGPGGRAMHKRTCAKAIELAKRKQAAAGGSSRGSFF